MADQRTESGPDPAAGRGGPPAGAQPARRPPRPTGQRRRRITGGRPHRVPVRFSAEEYAALRARAAAAGLTPAAYLAAAVEPRDRLGLARMSGEERKGWAAELAAVRRLTAAVGNNLNQLARAANSGADIDRGQAAATIRACDRAVERVGDVLDQLHAGRP